MAQRFRVPHTLILLFGMIVAALLLTYVLPQGSFERVTNEAGREMVVPGSYAPAEETVWLSPLAVFTAIPKGFAAAQEIIFFVFLIGGFFGVLRASGAVDALIGVLLETLGKRPLLLIAGGVVLFALGSSTIGMAEEYLPFVPILLALAIGLGFDAVTAIGILCVGYGVGYGVAVMNPFTVLIAQEVAGLQPTSGWWYRLLIAVPFIALGVHHVWRYARRVQADPSRSLVADVEVDPTLKLDGHPRLTGTHKLILALTGAALVVIIYGLSELSGWHWYVEEMGAFFVGLTVLIGLIARIGGDRVAESFCHGAAELTTTALLIGFARSILIVLEQGNVIDTIVQGIAAPLQYVGPSVAAIGMLVVQSLCNLFIPSGSGQAYVTMPIMAPVADLLEIKRQVAVLAYQFGDGFTNILVPTNAVLVGILGLGRIPYDRWLRFILPFMIKVWILAALVLMTAVWIGYA
ncbi:MAG: YfcC family protein [Planctomycetota bacterium]|nr:MAG: YfcC family protein [Planctomycetota bacterium]